MQNKKMLSYQTLQFIVCLLFIGEHILHHLKVGFALANPASSDVNDETNNSAAKGLNWCATKILKISIKLNK